MDDAPPTRKARARRRPGCHIEWDFINGPVYAEMRPNERLLYLTLWAIATQERRIFVCRLRWTDKNLARITGLDMRTLCTLLARVQQKCSRNAVLCRIIEVTDHWIKVPGVNDKQEWMTWKDPRPCCAECGALPLPRPRQVPQPTDEGGGESPPPRSEGERKTDGFALYVLPILKEKISQLLGAVVIKEWREATADAPTQKAAARAVLAFVNHWDKIKRFDPKKYAGQPSPQFFREGLLTRPGGWLKYKP